MKLLKGLTTAILILALILNFGCLKTKKAANTKSTGKPVTIPTKIASQKFGFLSGHPGSEQEINQTGASWSRPHVGPFVWDAMQKSRNADISFNQTDNFVQMAQENDLATLATIFPFADWDQKTKPDFEKYKVSDNDEFLPNNWKKEAKDSMEGIEIQYLPYYRSNPADWKAYEKWLSALVERYDGDGQKDMQSLSIPIKYWEIMNEPDLFDPEDAQEQNASLSFYKEDANAYAELLIRSSKIIKKADPGAKVVIAGAAGGNDSFLDFYRKVFANKEAIASFDIANVHCISNDSYDSFNVGPYKKMLAEFGIKKPIWVTEAEAVISSDPDINATQTYESTKKALELGADKIFFTRFDFENFDKKPPPISEKPVPTKTTLKGSDPIEAYKKITTLE